MPVVKSSLRGAERRSNLDFGRLEIASGFALAMTIFQSFRMIKTDITFKNLYRSSRGGVQGRTSYQKCLSDFTHVVSQRITQAKWYDARQHDTVTPIGEYPGERAGMSPKRGQAVPFAAEACPPRNILKSETV